MKPILTGILMALLILIIVWFSIPILLAIGSLVEKIWKKVTK